MLSLSEAITRKESLDSAYPDILKATRLALGADRIAILLADSDGRMQFRGWSGLSEEYRCAVDGNTPWSAGEQDPPPIFVPDCLSDPSLKDFREIFHKEGICALAFLPLCCDSVLVGKFMVYYNTPHDFNDSEISLAKTVARLVGFAIERARHEEAIQRRLLEKQLLLRELHHRVKNNLQLISSFLNLQSLHADKETRALFQQSQKRLQSMSLIHEKLMDLEEFDQVNLGRYIHELAGAIVNSYRTDSRALKLNVDADSDVVVTSSSAVSFGLIVNELLSNALKHAFIEKQNGSLSIALKKNDAGIKLKLQDDGCGFREPAQLQNRTSLGLRIVSILVEQVKGTLSVESSRGTSFTIDFPEPKLD